VAATGDAAAEFQACATRGCAAIEARVAAVSREGPVLLRSYEGTSTQPLEPALTSAAFAIVGVCVFVLAAANIGSATTPADALLLFYAA
jgi:hypothetical protein